jgi:hypothetical protein
LCYLDLLAFGAIRHKFVTNYIFTVRDGATQGWGPNAVQFRKSNGKCTVYGCPFTVYGRAIPSICIGLGRVGTSLDILYNMRLTILALAGLAAVNACSKGNAEPAKAPPAPSIAAGAAGAAAARDPEIEAADRAGLDARHQRLPMPVLQDMA